MPEQKAKKGLQVNEDRAWQEKFWTAQRVGWLVMLAIVITAMVGLAGKGGPLASAHAESGGARIDYPRITRWQSADQLTVTLPPDASGAIDVELSPAFAKLFQVEAIEPEPSDNAATTSGQRFTFDVEGGSGDKRIVFHVKASEPAIERAVEARVADGQPARAAITVLP
jgi:hypothetical protein